MSNKRLYYSLFQGKEKTLNLSPSDANDAKQEHVIIDPSIINHLERLIRQFRENNLIPNPPNKTHHEQINCLLNMEFDQLSKFLSTLNQFVVSVKDDS